MLPFDLLPAIAAFSRVVHHASFTRAAKELGVSPSALSQTVRMLEQRLGVRLLERTTRRVGITEIGQRFLDTAGAGLTALDLAVQQVGEMRDAPAGLLRLNLSQIAADLIVMPHLPEFLQAYPDVTVEMHCDNTFLDIVAIGFDAGIRLGESLARDMIAVPLGGRNRLATFAAPSYVERHGAPQVPADLLRHRCACVRLDHDRPLEYWDYLVDGQMVEVSANPAMISNNGELLINTARSGAAIGYHFEALVAEDLASGRLVPLLKDYWPTFGTFYLYYPSRVLMPRKLRVFIDFLRERQGVYSA